MCWIPSQHLHWGHTFPGLPQATDSMQLAHWCWPVPRRWETPRIAYLVPATPQQPDWIFYRIHGILGHSYPTFFSFSFTRGEACMVVWRLSQTSMASSSFYLSGFSLIRSLHVSSYLGTCFVTWFVFLKMRFMNPFGQNHLELPFEMQLSRTYVRGPQLGFSEAGESFLNF